jgi:ribosomal-protein-alanine N-acetyltransferase
VEVAYLLDQPYWGQGLATEAARGIVDYAFDTLGLPKLVCYMWPANRASERVAQKAGLRFEREMRGEQGAVTLVYAIARP